MLLTHVKETVSQWIITSDLKKVYDLVQREILYKIITELGISRLINVYQRFEVPTVAFLKVTVL